MTNGNALNAVMPRWESALRTWLTNGKDLDGMGNVQGRREQLPPALPGPVCRVPEL